jgi:hypothetical protein
LIDMAAKIVRHGGRVILKVPRAVYEHLNFERLWQNTAAAEPLRDYETVVKLIAATTTAKGLSVTCRRDRRKYPVGRKVSDKEFAAVNLKPQAFHGEWNYQILPRQNIKL